MAFWTRKVFGTFEKRAPDFQTNLLARERILNNTNVVCEDKLNRERALFSGCRRGFEKVACLISQTYNKLVLICNKKSAFDVFCCIITGFACLFWLTTCYRHGHNLVVLKFSKAARESLSSSCLTSDRYKHEIDRGQVCQSCQDGSQSLE